MNRKQHFVALAALTCALAHAAPAAAQSDILLRLRSGSPLGDRFRVDSASGFVAKGVLGIGIIPFTGAGERVMWHPFKAAFRAGSISSAGTEWDDGNTGFYSWAGGLDSKASGNWSFAFGDSPAASGVSSVAIGSNTTGAGTSSVAIGRNAWAGTSFRAATNTNNATAIGFRVTADADYSMAMGFRASTAGRSGAFVWGGSLGGASAATDSLLATADGQWSARAPGGYRLFTNTALTTGMTMNAGGSSWNVVSDRNRKENFLAVDGEDLLGRIRAVPVTTWRYREEADRTVRHIGPMAQDWHRAFGFNADDKTINMSDFDGVNLAAVQALEARTADQARQLEAQRRQLGEQRTQLDAQGRQIQSVQAENAELRARLERLEALVAGAAKP